MKKQNSQKFIYLLGISNLLFVGSYALLAIHALFLHDPLITQEIKPFIILGMSIFGATQVGGVWLLSLISDRLSTSILFLLACRIVGIILLVIPSGWAIATSLLAFGLSHAVYYKTSRMSLSELLKASGSTSSKFYLLFSLTTNLSYLVLPLLGSKILAIKSSLLVGSLIALVFALVGILLLKLSMDMTTHSSSDKQVSNTEAGGILNKKEFVADLLRFSGFILPYTIMMAIVPIKTADAGLPAIYNSIFLGFNSAIILLFQLLGLKFKITEYSTRKYDYFSIVAVTLTLVCLFVNIWMVVPLFVLWSICESYQMPNLEYHLFSKRTYSSKVINNILALDAVFCFLGPVIASMSFYVVQLPRAELISSDILNSIVNYFK